MTERAKIASHDLTFTDADFEVISRYAASRYGLDIKIEKKGLIYARLARRVRALNLPDFQSYCAMVTGTSAGDEEEELLTSLTTNVSSFFREQHHFDMLRDTILPSLQAKKDRGEKIRIWSAGCSNGQEPYSIAATVKEVWPDAGPASVSILATDVDPQVLEKGAGGIYRADEANALTQQKQAMLFERHANQDGTITVRRALKDMLTFDRLNLVSEWDQQAPFDVIFCRNVVIYFERTTQHRLWQKFSSHLLENGHLFIGHSERLTGPAETHFHNIGITSFVKSAP